MARLGPCKRTPTKASTAFCIGEVQTSKKRCRKPSYDEACFSEDHPFRAGHEDKTCIRSPVAGWKCLRCLPRCRYQRYERIGFWGRSWRSTASDVSLVQELDTKVGRSQRVTWHRIRFDLICAPWRSVEAGVPIIGHWMRSVGFCLNGLRYRLDAN